MVVGSFELCWTENGGIGSVRVMVMEQLYTRLVDVRMVSDSF